MASLWSFSREFCIISILWLTGVWGPPSCHFPAYNTYSTLVETRTLLIMIYLCSSFKIPWHFMNTNWVVFEPRLLTALQHIIFHGSFLCILQLLTSVAEWDLSIMGPLRLFYMVSNLLSWSGRGLPSSGRYFSPYSANPACLLLILINTMFGVTKQISSIPLFSRILTIV